MRSSVARDEASEIPNWGRELSVIDMLKGSDGHVYKGRFRQVCHITSKSAALQCWLNQEAGASLEFPISTWFYSHPPSPHPFLLTMLMNKDDSTGGMPTLLLLNIEQGVGRGDYVHERLKQC